MKLLCNVQCFRNTWLLIEADIVCALTIPIIGFDVPEYHDDIYGSLLK